MSDNWYNAVIEKFGTVDKFLDELCKKQGITDEADSHTVSEPQPKKTCLTVDEIISKLEEVKEIQGGDAFVYLQDSSGYNADCVGVIIDHNAVVIV